MKYSVVIPLYNKEHYIEKTVASVLRQTFRDYEIVIVNDGSTDRSLEVAQKFAGETIRIIDQPNQGVAVARNTGIHNARGTYIAFLDADDEWGEHYLETIDGITCRYPQSDIFVTAYDVDMGNGKVNHSTRLEPAEGCLDSYWLTLAKGYDFVWTSATTIRRQALLDAGCFTPGEKIGQDLDMWARVARNNPKVAYSARSCVTYNRSAEANARTRVRIAWAGAFIRVLEEELDNPRHTAAEIRAIQRKYDKKMTVYVFTSILAGDKKRAAGAMDSWKGKRDAYNTIMRTGLRCASIMPAFVCRWAYQIRMKVF